jgi:hypothetical protein
MGLMLDGKVQMKVTEIEQNLINGLLQQDPTERIGCRAGIEEIKGHPFFHGIKWNEIEK